LRQRLNENEMRAVYISPTPVLLTLTPDGLYQTLVERPRSHDEAWGEPHHEAPVSPKISLLIDREIP
jgi:hypothetical protein